MLLAGPLLKSQTIEAFKYQPTPPEQCGVNFDQLKTIYHITVGSGFDPAVDYHSLKIKVTRRVSPGGTPTSSFTDDDDGQNLHFEVKNGILYADGATTIPKNMFDGATQGGKLASYSEVTRRMRHGSSSRPTQMKNGCRPEVSAE